jgi:hypothetical protein
MAQLLDVSPSFSEDWEGLSVGMVWDMVG